MSHKVQYKQAKRDRSRIAKQILLAARQTKQEESRIERQIQDKTKKEEAVLTQELERKKAKEAIPTDILFKWYIRDGLIYGNTYQKGCYTTQDFDKSEFNKESQTVYKGKATWKLLESEQDKSVSKKICFDTLKMRDFF